VVVEQGVDRNSQGLDGSVVGLEHALFLGGVAPALLEGTLAVCSSFRVVS
jgi:hypothetical protein